MRALELVDQPVDDPLVPVVAAEVVVTAGGLDLDDAVADLQKGHVEGAAAQVEDQDRLLLLALVQPVGQRGGSGLVDDPQHVEARDRARFLGGLTLGVVEVGRDGDDGVGHRLAQVGLGVALELLQHASADLLGGVRLAVDVDLPVRVAHVALHRTDGAIDVGDGLALGDLADQHLAVLGERHHAGGGARTFGVRDDLRLAAGEGGHDRVGRAEVDTDRSGHCCSYRVGAVWSCLALGPRGDAGAALRPSPAGSSGYEQYN